MTQEEYNLLYEKFENGVCSDKDIEQLLKFEDNFVMIDQDWQLAMGDKESTREKILNKLRDSIGQRRKVKTLNKIYILAIAATLLLLMSVTLILFLQPKSDSQQITKVKKTEVILPGTDKAILKIADGSKIILDEIKIGKTLKYGNLSITKTNNGEIKYLADANSNNENTEGFNEITTPRGGQFSIVLQDGSKVWLNASSSLKFPKDFAENQRKVKLKGEGYFEITKNANKPFFVEAGSTSIKVLGTHFNISNYAEDNSTKTTLLEGSVEITAMGNKKTLVPNQEALYLNNSKSLELKNAPNATDAIAWKEGVFIFRDEHIQSIMQKLSRWYDVEVICDIAVVNEQFSGSTSRYQNIDKVLKQLELTGALKFKIQGRRIYVMK